MRGNEVGNGGRSARARVAGAVATIVALLTILLVAGIAPVSGQSFDPGLQVDNKAEGPIFIMPAE